MPQTLGPAPQRSCSSSLACLGCDPAGAGWRSTPSGRHCGHRQHLGCRQNHAGLHQAFQVHPKAGCCFWAPLWTCRAKNNPVLLHAQSAYAERTALHCHMWQPGLQCDWEMCLCYKHDRYLQHVKNDVFQHRPYGQTHKLLLPDYCKAWRWAASLHT